MEREQIDRCLKKSIVFFMIGFFIIFTEFIQPFLESIMPQEEGGVWNAWKENEQFDVKIYLSTREQLDLSKKKSYVELAYLQNLTYNLKSKFSDQLYEMNYTLEMKENILNNKTARYIIIVGSPTRCNFTEGYTYDGICLMFRQTAPLIRWEREKINLKHNLIKEKAVEAIPEEQRKIVPYYYGNLTFDLVFITKQVFPSMIYSHNYKYFLSNHEVFIPPISEDMFMHIDCRKTFINLTNPTDINYTIKFTMKSQWLWNKKLEFDESYSSEGSYIREQWEDIKRALWDTNPILLWCYIILAVAHVILKILAFKEDIGWWLEQKTLRGVSIQSVVFDAIAQFIILLYLKDENTNIIILATRAIGLFIQLWKLTKLFEPIMEFPYFKSRAVEGDETRDFDRAAGKIFALIIIPIIIIYSIYSLFTNEYKSFYSFFLKACVGAIYAFGFLAMFPQVYVNYKLKSVAGMSGTVLAFKFVSTFIDDLFAFIMTMPMMHRIACFRDDVVFFIWLYQRHIYRVDPTRANEYGETLADEEKAKEEKKKALEEEKKAAEKGEEEEKAKNEEEEKAEKAEENKEEAKKGEEEEEEAKEEEKEPTPAEGEGEVIRRKPTTKADQ